MIKDRAPASGGEQPWPEEPNQEKAAQSNKNGLASHAQHDNITVTDNTGKVTEEKTEQRLAQFLSQFPTPEGQDTATWLLEQIHTANNENTQLRERMAKMKDMHTRQQQAYKEIEQDRDYWKNRYFQEQKQRRKLWRTKLKPTEKAVIEEFQRQIDSPNTYTDEDDWKRMCFKTAGINLGIADKTTKTNFERVLDQCPDLLSLADAQIDSREEYDPEQNRVAPRLYIKTEKSLVDAAIRSEISQRIKQGGNRPHYFCQNPNCLSENVMVEHRIVCLDCGHVSKLDPTYPNGNLKQQKNGRNGLASHAQPENFTVTANTQNTEKNVVPENVLAGVVITKITSDPPPDAAKFASTEEEANEITSAAKLLLEIAGSAEEHIEMSRSGEKKYYTVHRPLTLVDLVDHLRGGQARGSLCSYGEQTIALCFDADNAADWDMKKQAARSLASAGYLPLLEESPAARGGHLWVIFDQLVNASAARAAVLTIVPELEAVIEYWPGPAGATSWNRVRLPGGKYVRYGKHVEKPVCGWCRILSVATGESSVDGLSAARLLLASRTPASIVPALSTEDQKEKMSSADPQLQTSAKIPDPVAPTPKDCPGEKGVRPLPVVDARWEKENGPVATTTWYVAITPKYAARWFNERNSLESVQPRERNGMAFSPNGNECTASTNYRETADGERYTDHSHHGRRADGTRDSGDALELAAKVKGISKGALLGQVIKEIKAQALAELEAAARTRRDPVAWVREIMTPAGWKQYDQLCSAASQCDPQPQEDYTIDADGDYIF